MYSNNIYIYIFKHTCHSMQKSLHQSFINHLLFVNHDHSSNSRINWGLFILLLNNDHFSRSTKNSSMLQWLRFIHHSIIHNKYVLHPPIVNNDDRKVWWSRRLCGGYALFSALHQSFTTWIIPRIVLRFCGWASEIQKNQLIGDLSHDLQAFNHPRWCRISQPSTVVNLYIWLLSPCTIRSQKSHLQETSCYHP